MNREAAEVVAYSAVAILALDNLLWWLAALGQMGRPLPRALWHSMTVNAGLLITASAVAVAGWVHWQMPEAYGDVAQILRLIVAGGTFLSLVSLRWWRAGWKP